MDVTLIGIVFELIRTLLRLFTVVLVVYVVISWLYAFDIVGRGNQFVTAVWRFAQVLIEPFARPLRRFIPPVGGFDLSVMVLFIIVWLLERLTYWLQAGAPIL